MNELIIEKFPLYWLRSHEKIYIEGNYRVIKTYFRIWVLDDLSSKEPSYTKRRMQMLDRKLPYPLYPLYNRVNSYRELIDTKYSQLIDDSGNLVLLRKTKSLPLKCERIVRTKMLGVAGDAFLIWLEKSKGPYKVYANVLHYKYARMLYITNKVREIYDFSEEEVPDTWRKI